MIMSEIVIVFVILILLSYYDVMAKNAPRAYSQ